MAEEISQTPSKATQPVVQEGRKKEIKEEKEVKQPIQQPAKEEMPIEGEKKSFLKSIDLKDWKIWVIIVLIVIILGASLASLL